MKHKVKLQIFFIELECSIYCDEDHYINHHKPRHNDRISNMIKFDFNPKDPFGLIKTAALGTTFCLGFSPNRVGPDTLLILD